jgi:hypothetical protein
MFDTKEKTPASKQPTSWPTPELPPRPTPPPSRTSFGSVETLYPSPNPDNPSDVGNEHDSPENTGSNTGSDTQSEVPDTGLEDEEFVHLPTEPRAEPVKVSFPGQRAGEVLAEGIPTMNEYENNLGGPAQNPYSPFNSEIDWEVAKWARLRGPSATSFTEFLQINGVCFFITL